MLKISRSSWHYRLCDYNFSSSIIEKKDFCQYFWQCVAAIILTPITFIINCVSDTYDSNVKQFKQSVINKYEKMFTGLFGKDHHILFKLSFYLYYDYGSAYRFFVNNQLSYRIIGLFHDSTAKINLTVRRYIEDRDGRSVVESSFIKSDIEAQLTSLGLLSDTVTLDVVFQKFVDAFETFQIDTLKTRMFEHFILAFTHVLLFISSIIVLCYTEYVLTAIPTTLVLLFTIAMFVANFVTAFSFRSEFFNTSLVKRARIMRALQKTKTDNDTDKQNNKQSVRKINIFIEYFRSLKEKTCHFVTYTD